MRVLLTGASGFIGKPVLKKLTESGFSVLAITRNLENKQSTEKVNWIKANLSDLSNIYHELLKFQPDVLIHLAWDRIPDFSLNSSQENLNLSINLIDLVIKIGTLKKIIVAGSCFEIENKNGLCLAECKIKPENYFTWAKISLFNWLKFECQQKDIDFSWMRIFYAYGPSQRKDALIPSIISNLKNRTTPVIKFPNNLNDFIHVNDIATAINNAVKYKTYKQIYNLGSGHPTKILDIYEIIKNNILGAGSNSEIDGVISYKTEMNFFADISNTCVDLDWKPNVSINTGLKFLCANI